MRPQFLTSPGAWIHAPRNAQSRTDAACAISHQPTPSTWNASDVVVALLLVGVLLAIVSGVL